MFAKTITKLYAEKKTILFTPEKKIRLFLSLWKKNDNDSFELI